MGCIISWKILVAVGLSLLLVDFVNMHMYCDRKGRAGVCQVTKKNKHTVWATSGQFNNRKMHVRKHHVEVLGGSVDDPMVIKTLRAMWDHPISRKEMMDLSEPDPGK